MTFTRSMFQEARDEMIKIVKSAKVPWSPSPCESGYFLPVDISKAKEIIPERYFKIGNYEDDKDTLVI